MADPRALRIRCPAKINLGLWILGRRPDGYHEIDTILQTVLLEDELLLEEAREGFALETRGIRIPKNGPNIIERAWSFMGEQARNNRRGVRVRLTKRIPIGAGLGGGSSDAAGFLIGVNRLLDLGFVDARLQEVASALGADVPFFLRGGTARATGRGDEVRHLCPLPDVWIVLATPPIAVSTTWAYGRVRIRLTPPGSGASMLAAAIERHDWGSIASRLHNDFEDVVLPELVIVAKLRRLLGESDLLGSLLSGSGSTVFGLALTQAGAQRAAERAAAAGATVHVVRTTERGVVMAGVA